MMKQIICRGLSGIFFIAVSTLVFADPTVDSDNDGVPDYLDAAPFDAGNSTEITLPLDAVYKGAKLSATQGVPVETNTPSNCVFVVSPTTMSFNTRTPTSGTTSMCVQKITTATVTATAGCSWSVTANIGNGAAGWLTIVSGAGPNVGTGAAQSFSYRVLSNAHNANSRSGSITVVDLGSNLTSAVLSVSQIADPGHVCP